MQRCIFSICFIAFTLGLFLLTTETNAQVNRKKSNYSTGSPTKSFEKTQFYIGIRGGVNLTNVHVI